MTKTAPTRAPRLAGRLRATALALLVLIPAARAMAGGPLVDLTRLSPARTGRVSSFNPDDNLDANADRWTVQPGETVTLADIKGPGAITHLWFTIRSFDPVYPRSLVLRAWWDDAEAPAIESPLGDFFAVGHGLARDVDSIPVQVSSRGRALNSYWRMPFHRRARFTLTNDSPRHPVTALYFYIDYERLPELPADTPYFHARYRQEFPCKSGDYVVLDTKGRGHFVGTVLSVFLTRAGWFGEGDDRFYVDGDTTPTLHGTGTEDYFAHAWRFREHHRPYSGVTVWEDDKPGGRGTAYRWHIVDPVRFERSLRFAFEHKGPIHDVLGKRIREYGERADYFSSVAFWYQTGEAKPFGAVPPLAERLPREIRITGPHIIEKEAFRSTENDRVHAQTAASGGRRRPWRLFFDPELLELTPWIEVDFDVPATGRYIVRGDMTHSYDYGTYRVKLDGAVVERAAVLYAEKPTPASHLWGIHALEAGRHTLRFDYVGHHASALVAHDASPGRFLGLRAVALIPLEDNAP